MHLKKKLIKLLEERTGVQWRDLDHKKIYITLILLVALLVLCVCLIVNAFTGKMSGMQSPDKEDVTVVDEQAAEVPEESAAEEDSLEVDAYEEINDLVATYFAGLANGDMEQVAGVVDVLTEEEKLTIEKKKEYIESYDQLVCYTKSGLEEGSYVVFAAYEMKIYNIDTAAPGIMALYVCTADDGSMYIFNGEASEELKEYVLTLASEEEVAAVISDVDARYQQLVAENEDLGKFADTMLQSKEENDIEPEAPTAEPTVAELEEPVQTIVTENVRLREERSADSAMLDTLAAGTGVTVYANYEDGWSKIEYQGMAGYCKTEFLENIEGVSSVAEEQTEGNEEQPEAVKEEASENTETAAVNQQMQFKETVTIRAERSTESDRVTSGYAMELVQVIESYSDGWSRIEYNGMNGYCKTEFLQEPQ